MTKGGAKEKLQQIIFKEIGQGVGPTDEVTLTWFWENRFKPMREGGWEEPTKDVNVRDFERYIKGKLGTKTLAELDKFVIQLHLNALAKANYSKPVIQRVKTLLSSIFIEAVELEFMRKNPMSQKKVKMPKCKPQHKPVIDVADVRRLYSALPSLRDRLIFRLGVFLGPRTSEVFGFTVNDWKGEFLEICNTSYNGTLRKAKTKTDGSHRTVPVPPQTRAMLKRWIEQTGLSGDDLIFPGRDGKSPMWPGVWMQKHLQSTARQIGITVPVTFQVLRRSFATRHRNELKDAQDVLGHANYETTTANVYAQSVTESVIAMLEEDERKMGLMEDPVEGVQ